MVDFFNQVLQDKKKLTLIAVVFLVFVYLDFSLVVSAQIKSAANLTQKTKQLKKDLDVLTKEIAVLTRNASQPQQMLKVKRIVKEREFPTLLQYISSLANNTNVKVMQIDSKKNKSSKYPNLNEYAIRLDIVSDYHQFGYFVSGLENADEFFEVTDIKIGRDSVDNMKEKITANIRTYAVK